MNRPQDATVDTVAHAAPPAQVLASTARPLRVALLGNPNCGKTALFNLLTGSRQKVANYAGVTVEHKEVRLVSPACARVASLGLRLVITVGEYSADAEFPR